MGSNRIIYIWIAIFALIGILLLMVACQTGVLTAPDTSQDQTSVQMEKTGENPAANEQGIHQTLPQTESKTESLTVGKQYSGKLVEDGTKNVLIIGEDKLSDLYDTIGIASIDQKNRTLKIIMIPRDTYIEYNPDILAKLEEVKLAGTPGIYKINCAHLVGSKTGYKGRFESGPTSFLAEVVREKFGVTVDDYIKINTKGFRALIDHLGGIDIEVPYAMNYDDPTQDLSIHISKGMHHLSGGEAEGFVRFRQGFRENGTYFEIGDPGRKKNQLYFLKELIRQKGTLKNIGKIPGMIDILGKNIQHSIDLGDMLQTYMGLARYIITDDYAITTENLTSEKMIRIRGSSYLVLE